MKPAAKTAPVAQSRTTLSSKSMGGAVSNQQVEELTNQVMDMRLNLEGLEKERDFYFSKLRDIEILCQEAEDADATPIIQKILEILYATEVVRDTQHLKLKSFN
jgi:microtubule-associated protein, RP/EB family